MTDVDELAGGAEQIVLGALMTDPAAVEKVALRLTGGQFYHPRHGTIYGHLLAAHAAGEPGEPVALARRLDAAGDLDRVGGANYLHELIAAVPLAVHVDHYAGIVLDAAERRAVAEQAARLRQAADISDPDRRRQVVADVAERISGRAVDDGEPARPVLEFLTVKELRAKVAAAGPRRWLLRGLWPAGDYGVFAGDMKAQKSWTVTDAVVSVASGTPWLGLVPVDLAGPVIMFVGEGGDADALRRIDAVCAARGISADDLPIAICCRAPHLSDQVHLGLMADQLDRVRPILTSLDPFYLSAGGAKGGDLYAMGQVLERPQHMCQEVNSSLIITTHQNRREGRGPTRITGAGPAEWGRVLVSATVKSRHLDKATTETTVITELDVIGGSIPGGRLRVVRRIVADDPDDLDSPLRYHVECTEVDEAEATSDAGEIKMPPARAKLLDALRAANGVPETVKALVDRIAAKHGHGLSRETCSKQLNALLESGLADRLELEKGGSAQWLITETGMDGTP